MVGSCYKHLPSSIGLLSLDLTCIVRYKAARLLSRKRTKWLAATVLLLGFDQMLIDLEVDNDKNFSWPSWVDGPVLVIDPQVGSLANG